MQGQRGCRQKGGGFSRLISSGRAGKGGDVMESGVSVTNTFSFSDSCALTMLSSIVKAWGTIQNDLERQEWRKFAKLEKV